MSILSSRGLRPATRPRPAGDPGQPEEHVSGDIGAGAILRAGAAFGLLFGFVEVAALLGIQAFLGPWTLGHLQLNSHFPWMIPATQLALFTIAATPLTVLRLLGIRVRQRVAFGYFLAIGLYSLVALIEGLHDLGMVPLCIGLAVATTGFLGRRQGGWDRLISYGLLLQIIGLAAVAGICYDRIVLAETRVAAPIVAGPHQRQNVLLIVLDTVSARHLTVYDPTKPTTPNLARLAAKGVVFENARSTAPWTYPSHASLFTGRWPHELDIADEQPLDDTYPTLAEYFAENGYSTGGFVANTYYGNSWFGLGRGFVRYEDRESRNVLVSPVAAMESASLGRKMIKTLGLAENAREGSAVGMKDAARINSDFLAWVDSRPKGHFFAFLNFMDAHDPYFAAPSDGRRCGVCPRTPDDEQFLRGWHQADKKALDSRQKAMAENAYENCLTHLDEQLGSLVDELERRSILDETLVIITADHGEAFGEHGLFLHGQSVYGSETHVPLIVLNPRSQPKRSRIPTHVSLRDVAATIVDELDLTSESPFPGQSLARFWTSDSPIPEDQADPVLIEGAVKTKVSRNPDRVPAQRGPLSAVIARGWSYIVDAVGREELYDLTADPGETTNLAVRPELAERIGGLRAALNGLLDPE